MVKRACFRALAVPLAMQRSITDTNPPIAMLDGGASYGGFLFFPRIPEGTKEVRISLDLNRLEYPYLPKLETTFSWRLDKLDFPLTGATMIPPTDIPPQTPPLAQQTIQISDELKQKIIAEEHARLTSIYTTLGLEALLREIGAQPSTPPASK